MKSTNNKLYNKEAMEAVASGGPGGGRADGNVFFYILFNYKILSRFVALIYFVMTEKNPKRILILYVNNEGIYRSNYR